MFALPDTVPVVPSADGDAQHPEDTSVATESAIGADNITSATAPAPPSVIVPVAQGEPMLKRDKPTTPEVAETPVEPAAHRARVVMSVDRGFQEFRGAERSTLKDAGCPVQLDVERTCDGWFVAEGPGAGIRIDSGTSRISMGKHQVSTTTHPFASVYVQECPGGGWKAEYVLVLRNYLPIALSRVVHRSVVIYHPSRHGHEVLMVHPQSEEMTLNGDSDSEAESSEASPSVKKLVPKKVRKQLDREIPFELIPVARKHLYEAAILKEWQEWLGWDAVEILSRAESEKLWQDPEFRRAVIPTRFAFRNKHAGRDPTEFTRLNLALVAAKARLCIQGFRQKNKHLLSKDSPTISRVGFFCVLQVVCSCNFTLFS